MKCGKEARGRLRRARREAQKLGLFSRKIVHDGESVKEGIDGEGLPHVGWHWNDRISSPCEMEVWGDGPEFSQDFFFVTKGAYSIH